MRLGVFGWGRGKGLGALKRKNLSHFFELLIIARLHIGFFASLQFFDVVKIVLIFCPNLAKWTNKLSDYK